MANSSIAVTAGSGTSVDTRTTTTDGDHRQVVVLGDPATDAGVAPVDATNGLKVDVAASSGVGSLTETAPTTDTASSGVNGRLQRIAQRTTSLIALLPSALGQTTKAASLGISIASDDDVQAKLGIVTETAPTTDTASSGLNGRLQRIAQRITTLIASTLAVAGDVAHDGVDSGNPAKIGGIAKGSQRTAVADADRVDAAFDRHGNQYVRTGFPAASVWTQIHVPAANIVATKSQAAGAAGVRNVCTGLTVVIAAGATAPTAINVTVSLIDGATGGTTYLWRTTLSLPATAGETRGITRSGLWLPGTAATAMTLEFSVAGGANTIESVSFEGVTITE